MILHNGSKFYTSSFRTLIQHMYFVPFQKKINWHFANYYFLSEEKNNIRLVFKCLGLQNCISELLLLNQRPMLCDSTKTTKSWQIDKHFLYLPSTLCALDKTNYYTPHRFFFHSRVELVEQRASLWLKD